MAHHAPLSQKELPTTDGGLALSNFQAQIAGQEQALRNRQENTGQMSALITLYGGRGAYLGRLADYDLAMDLAEQLVRKDPKQAESYLKRAGIRAKLHRFAEALSDLKKAAELGAKTDEVDEQRASILQAQGAVGEARSILDRQAKKWPNFARLSALAMAYAGAGDAVKADQLFTEAQYKYDDVSPFAVSWLYFQQGLTWENEGRLGRAREFFEEAHARLPAYAPVTSHLASMEAKTSGKERAIKLLREVVAQADDPEYKGQLCGLLREGGAEQKAEADGLCLKARSGYEDLLKKHPQAFATHAARFFLSAGNDAKRALSLAQTNLVQSPTSDGYDLALEAALAAGPPALGCELADQAAQKMPGWRGDLGIKSAGPPPFLHLHVLSAKAYAACGRADQAAQELKAASVQ